MTASETLRHRASRPSTARRPTGSSRGWTPRDCPEPASPSRRRFISGGSQNEIYELRRGDLHGAMRIPPPTAPADRDKGIVREWRIIEALDGTDVPHTEAIAVCTDPSVLGRTFYLMGFVDGWSPMELHGGPWPAPFDTDLEARQGLAYELVEGIARLSKVDWRAKGLEDLGRPDGFHERQVDRWTAFLERIKGRELPGFDEASAWLRSHKPIDFIPGLMHGDYQFANVMYEHGAPARLAAIVDWEMGTVGDPKLDLAWVVQTLARGHHRGRRHGRRLRRHDGDAARVGGARPLRRGVRPPGRRHRLLRHPRQVEAGRSCSSRASSAPATARRCRRSGPSCSTSCRRAAELAETTDYRPDVRAAVCRSYGPPEASASRRSRRPPIAAGQVRVRVDAAAVNFPDVLLVADEYQINVPTPFVPGSEFAGVVGGGR